MTNNNGRFQKGHVSWIKGLSKESTPMFGKRHSPETIKKMSDARKINPIRYWFGKKLPREMIDKRNLKIIGMKKKSMSDETKKRMSEAQLKRDDSTRPRGWLHTEEHKRMLSLKLKGKSQRKRTPEENKRNSEVQLRRPPWKWKSDESRKKMSEIRKKNPIIRKGSDNNKWKGGITSENDKIRKSPQYHEWRMKVYVRDHFTCQACGEVGGELNAHHIKPFSLFKELRFDVNNGITLCKKCHKETDTYLSKCRKKINN